MKIFHAPSNVASQTSIVAMCQRTMGEKVFGLVRSGSIYQTNKGLCTISVNAWKQNPLCSILGRLAWFFSALYGILWADVIHWHFAANKILPARLDLLLISLLNKKCIVQFYGSDIRDPEVADRLNPYLKDIVGSSKYKIDQRTSASNQFYFRGRGIACIAPTYELAQYVQPGIFTKIYCIKVGIDLDNYSPQFPKCKDSVLRIRHTPSNQLIKGTEFIIRAIDKLSRTHSIDFQIITGKTHDDAILAIRECDVFIDQLIIGDYGVSAIEAMALGKPVVCYIAKGNQKEEDACPIINATIESLYEVLLGIANTRERLPEIGRASRAYVERFHDAAENSRKMIEIYKSL